MHQILGSKVKGHSEIMDVFSPPIQSEPSVHRTVGTTCMGYRQVHGDLLGDVGLLIWPRRLKVYTAGKADKWRS